MKMRVYIILSPKWIYEEPDGLHTITRKYYFGTRWNSAVQWCYRKSTENITISVTKECSENEEQLKLGKYTFIIVPRKGILEALEKRKDDYIIQMERK